MVGEKRGGSVQAKQDTKVRGQIFRSVRNSAGQKVIFRARPGGESEGRSTDRPLGSGSRLDLEEELRWWGFAGQQRG